MPSPLLRLPGLVATSGWPEALEPGSLHCRHRVAGEPWLFALTLPNALEAWIGHLLPGASPERREAAARYRQPMDALRCLGSEALLRHAAREILGLEPEALGTAKGLCGKPAFVDHPEFHFNLSHSGPWILCALHDAPVGLDVEQLSTRALDAAEAFMSPEEWQRHRGLPLEARRADFFRLWTLKESLLKAAGTGLSLDPRSITIPGDGRPLGAPPAPAGRAWALGPLPMPPEARAALCFARGLGVQGPEERDGQGMA